ncbi:putative F-box protein PP2-B12 [Tripterygium wilfordii]|uniref:Putative F-box protein PP2-B12 n=1 Tax=Tripterygium wilfordii TaxID=458696 RepID=A0A7J7CHN9_TRIWF|nr:putative F-box protein PP2-B12 [Tripterygium wilfordii]KAF5733536.1 putative F-box protein PP2-B12 [Tripterygium wilfordii]
MANNVGDFDILPEGCIAKVLSFTEPRDACRLSLVSPIFRLAAESDSVWDTFLPPDCQPLISRSSSSNSVSYGSKKELYLSLCEKPLLIDGGAKSFSLDKWTGKKCYMLSARDLRITWSSSPSYWRWISLPESRFGEVAELLHVCWLEIRGKIHTNMLSAGTFYAAYLVFKKTEGTFGFDSQPVEAAFGLVGEGGDSCNRTLYLDAGDHRRLRHHYGLYRRGGRNIFRFLPVERECHENKNQDSKERGDGWLEVELGDFFNSGAEDGELEVFVLEVKGGNWKSGLIVQGIEIRPKGRDPK